MKGSKTRFIVDTSVPWMGSWTETNSTETTKVSLTVVLKRVSLRVGLKKVSLRVGLRKVSWRVGLMARKPMDFERAWWEEALLMALNMKAKEKEL